VYEKENHLRVMMRMMGLGSPAYWLINYAFWLAMYPTLQPPRPLRRVPLSTDRTRSPPSPVQTGRGPRPAQYRPDADRPSPPRQVRALHPLHGGGRERRAAALGLHHRALHQDGVVRARGACSISAIFLCSLFPLLFLFFFLLFLVRSTPPALLLSPSNPPPPLPSRTKWTRLVHPSVLIGNVPPHRRPGAGQALRRRPVRVWGGLVVVVGGGDLTCLAKQVNFALFANYVLALALLWSNAVRSARAAAVSATLFVIAMSLVAFMAWDTGGYFFAPPPFSY
jgi:hypothetical protein